MSRQTLVTLAVIAAIALVLGGLLAGAYERGRWKERVQDLEAQVDSTEGLLVQYRADSTSWARRQDSLETRASLLARDSVRLAQAAADIEQGRQAALARLRELEPRLDTAGFSEDARRLVGRLREALTATEGSLAACGDQLKLADERRGLCEVQLADRDARIQSLERLRGRLTSERDSAIALLKPPPLISLSFDLGLGAGCVLSVAGWSPVCGPSAHLTLLRFRFPLLDLF